MSYCKLEDVKRYLARFDEILNNMADEMLSQKTTNNITIDFINCMIPHHQAAIYMCENLLKYTKYRPLQEIANNIIITQTKGIEQMRRIRMMSQNYMNNREDVKNYTNEYLKITKNMIFRMRNSYRSSNINLNFTSEMIPHHEGAIEMCHNLLKYPINPRLKIVADEIIKEQSEGVKQLREVQRDLYRR